MSKKTLAGISAAAILSILAGNAYAEVTTPNYSTGFDGSGTTHAASTILGGEVFNFPGGGDWEGSPAYVLVRGTTDNKAVTLASNVTPYKTGIVGSGDFSFHTVAQMVATTSPKVIASVSDDAWRGGKTGLTLVYQNGNVKLISWKNGTGNTVILDAAVTGAETGYHSYLVTLKKSTEEGVASTAKVFVDGVQVGDTVSVAYEPGTNGYQIGGILGGTGYVSVDGTACVKGEGILVDDAAFWQSDVSAEAADIAAKFPVWTATVSEITLQTGDVNWSTIKPESIGDELEITLEGDTNLTLGEAVNFGNLVVKGTGTLLITDPSNCTIGSLTKEGSADFGYLIDATAGLTADETIKGYIQNTSAKLVIKGSGEGDEAKGLTVDFGTSANFTLNSHLVFDGGKHTFKYGRSGGGDFGGGATDANPTILVKGSTTLDLVGKDLTGWDGAYNANGVIRVNDGGTLNFQSYSGNTIYYRQRLVIDPGATVNVPENDRFRLYGGAANDTIFVPANGGTKVATLTGTIGLYKDGTTGFGINIGSGSKLQLNGKIQQGNATNYQFAKRGAGTLSGLQIDGNTTIVNGITKLDGVKILSGTTIHMGGDRTLLGTTEIAAGATLDLRGNDIFGYENVATMIVKGTLQLNAKRQTVKNPNGGLNTIILHPGAVITGTMPSEADGDTPAVSVDGGCHLNVFQNTVFKMVKDDGEEGDTATISAILGPQGANGMTVDVAAGLTLDITTPSSSSGSGRQAGIVKTGAGTLKLADTADISTLAALKVSSGAITVVEGASIPSAGVTLVPAEGLVLRTTTGEGETTYAAVQTYTVTLGTFEHTKIQFKVGDGEWTDVEGNVYTVDAGTTSYFRYVSEDETQWTVTNGENSAFKWTGISENKTYTPDASKAPVVSSVKTPAELFLEGIAAGGEVSLTDSITVGEWIVVDKVVTIDLAGHTITAAETFTGDAVIAIKHGGALTLKDSATGGTVDGSAVMCGIKMTQNASDTDTTAGDAILVIEGGVVIGKNFGISGNGNRAGTQVTVSGGTVKAVMDDDGIGIYQPQLGSLTISGGTVQGTTFGVYAKSGSVSISGGTIKSTATEIVDPTVSNNGTNGKGYALVLEKLAPGEGGYADNLTCDITGGTFEGVTAILSWARTSSIRLTMFVADGVTLTETTPSAADIMKSYTEGPTDWTDVTDDDVTTIITLPEGQTETAITATELKAWAEKTGATFGGTIPVEALIFNVAPSAAPGVADEAPTAEEAASAVLEEVIKAEELDLAELLAKAVEAGEGGLTITSLSTEYPMATIKLVPATLGEEVETSAKLFKLQLELK